MQEQSANDDRCKHEQSEKRPIFSKISAPTRELCIAIPLLTTTRESGLCCITKVQIACLTRQSFVGAGSTLHYSVATQDNSGRHFM
jgi:hypothetical protein